MFTNTPYNQYFQQSPNMNTQVELFNDQKTSYQNQVFLPQPTGLPWSINEMPWGTQSPPKVVEFTAQPPENIPKLKLSLPHKRKSELEMLIPNKQMKTDEVMAAHLNSLHISPDFRTHSKANDLCLDIDEDFSLMSNDELMQRLKAKTLNLQDGRKLENRPQSMLDIEEDFTDSNEILQRMKTDIFNLEDRLKSAERIVLCDEMRKLKHEPIIPQSILDRIEKPCMSLVLWKPPNRINNSCGNNMEDTNNNACKNKNSKRSVLISECNAMDIEM